MKPKPEQDELNALRRAIGMVEGLTTLAEGEYGANWGLPRETLEEVRHALAARFGELLLAREAAGEWEAIP